jgi:predicted ATP-binding protein involved in virulence
MGQLLVLELPDLETRKAIAQCLMNLKIRASADTRPNRPPTRTMKMVKSLEDAISEVSNRSFSFTVGYDPTTALKVFWGEDKEMPMMSLPDGLRGILGWLAATVARLDVAFPDHPDPLSVPFILIVDEPEGHLHPGWQRLLLPATQRLFPNAQIFVATHSPFMVSSVNEGFIHILETRVDGKVTVRTPPMECQKGDTYQDVLEDVLGMTDWYDPETEGLLSDFRKLRDDVLKGAWSKLPELEVLSQQIANRGLSLSNMMGREMVKVNRAKPA